jgi:hypothetical protein
MKLRQAKKIARNCYPWVSLFRDRHLPTDELEWLTPRYRIDQLRRAARRLYGGPA